MSYDVNHYCLIYKEVLVHCLTEQFYIFINMDDIDSCTKKFLTKKVQELKENGTIPKSGLDIVVFDDEHIDIKYYHYSYGQWLENMFNLLVHLFKLQDEVVLLEQI
jgi:hypothetical protein